MLVSVSYIVLLFVFVPVTYYVILFREQNIVQHIQEIVAKYENRLREAVVRTWATTYRRCIE